jgi:hypothetical protein
MLSGGRRCVRGIRWDDKPLASLDDAGGSPRDRDLGLPAGLHGFRSDIRRPTY